MFGDFFRVVGASANWAKEVSLDVAKAYLRFLQRAVLPSTVALAAACVALLTSEYQQIAVLNVVGLLIVGAVLLFWLLAAQPVVEGLVILGDQAPPVKRICDRMITGTLALAVVLLAAMHMPAGVKGLHRIGILAVFLAGAMILGLRITRKAIGVKFIVVALLMTASLVLPRALSSISAVFPAADVTIRNVVVPNNKEIRITLDSISGRDRSAPRLFIDGSPNWFCRRDRQSSSGYRCYEYPGRDEATNDLLEPITTDMIKDIEASLLAKERIEAETAAREQEAKRQALEASLLATERIEAETAAREQEAKRQALEAQAIAQENARKIALQQREAEVQAREEQARSEWESFDASIKTAPLSWQGRPSWRSEISGKKINIQYTADRRSDAIEIARRLHALGASVLHSRVVSEGGDSVSQVKYSFQDYETADSIRAASIQVSRLDLLSRDSGTTYIDVLLN